MKRKKKSQEEDTEAVKDEVLGEEGSDDGLSELDRLAAESAEYLANWQRAKADYANLRRRATDDLQNGVRRKLEPLLSDLLLVLDHLDMALASPAETEDAKNMRFGVELVRKQVVTLLDNSEVEAIDEQGPFDPDLHQAISKIEEEGREHEEIQTTVRRGYLFQGRPLRFAQVVVAVPPAPPVSESPADAPGEPGPQEPDDQQQPPETLTPEASEHETEEAS